MFNPNSVRGFLIVFYLMLNVMMFVLSIFILDVLDFCDGLCVKHIIIGCLVPSIFIMMLILKLIDIIDNNDKEIGKVLNKKIFKEKR